MEKTSFFNFIKKTWPAIMLLTLSLYMPSFFSDFVWDDSSNLVNNPHIKSFKNIPSFFINSETFSGSDEAQIYRPARNILFSIEWFFFGNNPYYYHYTNVFLHAVNAILLCILLIRVFAISNILALFFSLVFAMHPVNTEVICPAKGLEDIVCVFFGLLCLIQFYKFLKKPTSGHLFTVVLFYSLSIFSKEAGIFLIFIIIYEIFSFREKVFKQNHLLITLTFITLIYAFLRTYSLKGLGQAEYLGGSFLNTLFLMSDILAGYIKIIFIPVAQRVNYMGYIPFTQSNFLTNPFTMWLFIFIIFIPFLIIERTRKFCFYLFLSIMPVLNLVPMMQWGAERFLYFPLIFFLILMAVFLNPFHLSGKAKKITVSILISYLCLLSFLNYERQKVWKNNETLGREMIKVNPLSFQGYHLILSHCKKNGKYNKIIVICEELVKKSPLESSIYEYLAFAHLNLGNIDRAYEVVLLGLKNFPDSKLLQKFNGFLPKRLKQN